MKSHHLVVFGKANLVAILSYPNLLAEPTLDWLLGQFCNIPKGGRSNKQFSGARLPYLVLLVKWCNWCNLFRCYCETDFIVLHKLWSFSEMMSECKEGKVRGYACTTKYTDLSRWLKIKQAIIKRFLRQRALSFVIHYAMWFIWHGSSFVMLWCW